jgi:hypothetical protein
LPNGVSADGLGNVYLSGNVSGLQDIDASVSKYDAAGDLQWTRRLQTLTRDNSSSVSADGLGNVFISGATNTGLENEDTDVFLSKFDAAGTLQWTREFGTTVHDGSYDVSADGLGNVYISGYTHGSLGEPNAGNGDAFISKYDAAGNIQWTRQLGTAEADNSFSVSADGLGNAYITGSTWGSLGGPNQGNDDAFVSKYDAAGTLQWTRQLGTPEWDIGVGVSADGLGNIYISGNTTGSLAGPNTGGWDAFLSKHDEAGNLQWTRQLASQFPFGSESRGGVSADGQGNVFISGFAWGSFYDDQGEITFGTAAFVSKYDAAGNLQWTAQSRDFLIPEPASWPLVAIAGTVFLGIRGRRRIGLARGVPSRLGFCLAVLALAQRRSAAACRHMCLLRATAGDGRHDRLGSLPPTIKEHSWQKMSW